MGPGLIKPGSISSPNPIPQQIVHHAALVHDLVHKAGATTRRLLGEGDAGHLSLLRLHTRAKEYIVAPADNETLLIVQAAHSAAFAPLVKIAEAEQMAALASSAKGGDAKKK